LLKIKGSLEATLFGFPASGVDSQLRGD